MTAKEQRRSVKIPPILDDLDDELRDYLLKPELLPIHKWERSQIHWPREVDLQTLFNYKNIDIKSAIKPLRDHSNGKIIGWREVIDSQIMPRNDVTMKRPPLPPHLATQGMVNCLPFLPAGFEDVHKILGTETAFELIDDDSIPGFFMGEELLFHAPNMPEGVIFAEDGFTPLNIENNSQLISKSDISLQDNDEAIDLTSLVEKENHLIGLWTDNDDATPSNQKFNTQDNLSTQKSPPGPDDALFDECFIEPKKIMPDLPILNISTEKSKSGALGITEWAEMLDVTKPVEDFELKIPKMAHNFPFELDTFQKQAILKLEEQAHVFVAAHTSAGKTVVAEYAIALSMKHCTRTIYTSPIKALSNQKYRDFSRTFGDVGLLTGELQINTTASCLVMTTEILRSMLYRGSDVVRDLEYVIFDEVHYINNAERGYVWEEVLILLPTHVTIVMLSATVPNTLEFADWVGRTKKRKVYVVSTLKRPVPLLHYLYTGSSGSSKDELFLIVNQDGMFIQTGYDKAVMAKKIRQSDNSRDFGPKGPRNLKPNAEQTMWIAFIDHLRTNNKLPVVAFVLSRNRCDKISEALRSIDLTTAREKSRIHTIIQNCLKRLKDPDKKLPQVMTMQSLLSSGIGIHHSGILPILKEIVEMLFQSGLVKILFATETFAMGVNMPARTVVFDSVTKFDGVEVRYLYPAEYIQMAGRAGRRGLDATGSVIILCKKDVPYAMTLKATMLGKPMKLSSQFRITYSTMLSLLRATSVSVEGMMQRSFREFGEQCKTDNYKKELEDAEKKAAKYAENPLPLHLERLSDFHDIAVEYTLEMWDLMPVLLTQPKNLKYLVPGRVLLISIGKFPSQPVIYLNSQGPSATPYKVLALNMNEGVTTLPVPSYVDNTDIWYSIIRLAKGIQNVISDQTTLHHSILCITAKNIAGVASNVIKINIPSVIMDYEKRQQFNKRNNEPIDECKNALVKLAQLSFAYFTGAKEIDLIDLKTGLKIYNGEILQSIDRLTALKLQLDILQPFTNIANLEQELSFIYERKQLKRKVETLKKLLSYEAMALYPNYQRRLQVLKELRYVDDQNRVAMKGRVACEMKTNELIITELVFRNILTDLEPAMIAALLSCLVFQARTQIKPDVDDSLRNNIEAIKSVDLELSRVEEKYMVGLDDPACLADRLNFGLVQVVYDWAKGKPFSEIVNLTDVQEGIIVRNIQQLHEVLSNVKDAAKIIGDPMLQAKMEEVSETIKRDIVFIASLYTQDDVMNL